MKMLSKLFSGINVSLSGGLWTLNSEDQQARILIQAPNYCLVAQDTYFDLAGMTIDDQTLFLKLAQVQRYFPPTLTAAVSGDNFDEFMIMTTHPLTDAQLLLASADVYKVCNFEQLVYASCRRYVQTADEDGFGSPALLHDNVTSGAEATASDRIYCYRMSSPAAKTQGSGVTAATTLSVNFVIVADAKKESDMEYIMRLMRSYQLQNEPDND